MATIEGCIFKGNSRDLTASEKLVLLAIKHYIGDGLYSDVSIGLLARSVTLSYKTTWSKINTLHEKGWLNVENRGKETKMYSIPNDKLLPDV